MTRDAYNLALEAAIRSSLAHKIAMQVIERMVYGDLTLAEAGMELKVALEQIERWRLGRPLPAWTGHKG